MSWSSRSASTRTVGGRLRARRRGGRRGRRRARAPARDARRGGGSSAAHERLGGRRPSAHVARAASSPSGRRAPAASRSSASVATHASTRRPAKRSTASGAGIAAEQLAVLARARSSTMNARTAGIWHVLGEVARRRARRGGRRRARRQVAGRGASPTRGELLRRACARATSARRRSIERRGRRAAPRRRPSIASTAASSASRHSSSTSIASRARPPVRWRSSSKTSSICVRERRHAGEAHRRAHALQRVRDAEDLVDGLAVVGALLDAHDREVELLEVLARLGEEHRRGTRNVHVQTLR